MNESAIDDLLTQSLSTWYSHVSQWMPGAAASFRPCNALHGELAVVIAAEAWPHELVDDLAALVEKLVQQVTESFLEEFGGDLVFTEAAARSTVMRVLVLHGEHIRDVLEQCIRYRLEAFELLELELAELGGF